MKTEVEWQSLERCVWEDDIDAAPMSADGDGTRPFYRVVLSIEEIKAIRWLIKSACLHHPFGDEWEREKAELERLAAAVKAPYHEWKMNAFGHIETRKAGT